MKNMAMYNDLGSPEQPLVKRNHVVEIHSVYNFGKFPYNNYSLYDAIL